METIYNVYLKQRVARLSSKNYARDSYHEEQNLVYSGLVVQNSVPFCWNF